MSWQLRLMSRLNNNHRVAGPAALWGWRGLHMLLLRSLDAARVTRVKRQATRLDYFKRQPRAQHAKAPAAFSTPLAISASLVNDGGAEFCGRSEDATSHGWREQGSPRHPFRYRQRGWGVRPCRHEKPRGVRYICL